MNEARARGAYLSREPPTTGACTHRINVLEPPLMRSQFCHKGLVFHPLVVKVASFIVGDIWRCQQLVIDPESELWAEE